MESTMTLKVKLDSDDFLSIVDTAGYAIGYWAEEAEVDDSDDSAPTYTVACEDGTEIYPLDKGGLEQAIRFIVEGRVTVADDIRNDVTSAIKDNDLGYIDGYAADAIIQVACFGELIYG